MRVTLKANGYKGMQAEVASTYPNGAKVTLNRKGIDLAPRTIFFNWDAIKDGEALALKVAEPTKPAVGDLKAMETLAIDLMGYHGLTARGWRFAWDNRSVKTAGWTRHAKLEISLSKKLLSLWTLEQARLVILHEIAHALTPGHRHDSVWRQKCLEIGGNGERCWGSDGEASLPPKYVGYCPNGHKHTRDRKPRGADMNRLGCAKCSPIWSEKYLISWQRQG